MKKSLTMLAGACFLAGTCMIAGCGEESSVKDETTIKAPGGESKTTTETKVEKSGENPPPAP